MSDKVIDYNKVKSVLIDAHAGDGELNLVVDGRRIRGKVTAGTASVLSHRDSGKKQTLVLEFRLENAVITEE